MAANQGTADGAYFRLFMKRELIAKSDRVQISHALAASYTPLNIQLGTPAKNSPKRFFRDFFASVVPLFSERSEPHTFHAQ